MQVGAARCCRLDSRWQEIAASRDHLVSTQSLIFLLLQHLRVLVTLLGSNSCRGQTSMGYSGLHLASTA